MVFEHSVRLSIVSWWTASPEPPRPSHGYGTRCDVVMPSTSPEVRRYGVSTAQLSKLVAR